MWNNIKYLIFPLHDPKKDIFECSAKTRTLWGLHRLAPEWLKSDPDLQEIFMIKLLSILPSTTENKNIDDKICWYFFELWRENFKETNLDRESITITFKFRSFLFVLKFLENYKIWFAKPARKRSCSKPLQEKENWDKSDV